jgi:hypothetical protein
MGPPVEEGQEQEDEDEEHRKKNDGKKKKKKKDKGSDNDGGAKDNGAEEEDQEFAVDPFSSKGDENIRVGRDPPGTQKSRHELDLDNARLRLRTEPSEDAGPFKSGRTNRFGGEQCCESVLS